MRILITGGAGFIGTNLAQRLLMKGHAVTIYDNLSRPRTTHNLEWLREIAAGASGTLAEIIADIRDAERLARAAQSCDAIFHLASQVAVTTSVRNPREDFEINAFGTFNALEAARLSPSRPMLIYASTNKVYGAMEDIALVEEATRYRYRDLAEGVSEEQPIDPHSPYGCSKCAGDQYVHDYQRIYGLRTVVFRQSAIYGPRQFGVEDQGWAAHFIIAAATGRPISIYGDGKQVRDMLYIDDLIDAYELAMQRIDEVSGRVYNIGGGPHNSLSIWAEFQPILSRLAGRPVEAAAFGDWRPGDQPVCILAIAKAMRELGWQPRVGIEEGLARLWGWVNENLELFR